MTLCSAPVRGAALGAPLKRNLTSLAGPRREQKPKGAGTGGGARPRRLEEGVGAAAGRAAERAAAAGSVRAGALLEVVAGVAFRVVFGAEAGTGG